MKKFDRFDENNRKLYDDKIYKIIDAGRAEDLGLYEEKEYKNGNVGMVKSKANLPQKLIVTLVLIPADLNT
jgi:hypothetical protein